MGWTAVEAAKHPRGPGGRFVKAASRLLGGSDDRPFDTPENRAMTAAQRENRSSPRSRPSRPNRAAVTSAMREGNAAADREQARRVANSPWASDGSGQAEDAATFPKQARRRATKTASPDVASSALRGIGVFSTDPEIRRRTIEALDAQEAEIARNRRRSRRSSRY